MAKEIVKKITTIGGQALIEGILMKGPQRTEIAIRMPDGTISSEELEVKSYRKKYAVLRLPLIRGVTSFIESMLMGFKALALSAEKSGLEDDSPGEPTKLDIWLQKTFGDKIMNLVLVLGTVLGLALAVVLFFLLPTLLFNLGRDFIFGAGAEPLRSIVEGVMRILIFLAYIMLCAKMPEIKRVFQYHGAEHKTIFCYESGEPLTVENVKKHTRFHPRCGTSFLILMLVLGIVVGYFIPFTNPFLRTLVKLLCVPLVMAVGWEILQFCGRHDNWFTRIISAPGLWMQRLTTGEPEDSMIEVAIAAMQKVIPDDGSDLRK